MRHARKIVTHPMKREVVRIVSKATLDSQVGNSSRSAMKINMKKKSTISKRRSRKKEKKKLRKSIHILELKSSLKSMKGLN